jgi:hypothetical protein
VTPLERGLKFLGEGFVGKVSEVPIRILVYADFVIYMTKHILVGPVQNSEGQLELHLKGRQSKFLKLLQFGVQMTRECTDAFLISVGKGAPIAVVLPEMAHILGSQS